MQNPKDDRRQESTTVFIHGVPVMVVILDLDGVITQTAKQHARAWKQMFDQYLRQRSQETGEPFRSMSIEEDYPRFLDGKPRYDGVRSFLQSRGIELPFGDPGDEPGAGNICGLGNQKNVIFRKVVDEEGVDVYDDAVTQIRKWRQLGLRTAVVSSSKNCEEIVRSAGLGDLFDARVDGVEIEEASLPGKPHPDAFLRAARKLDVLPSQAAVIEDAEAGVQAGKAGGFGLVVGVARKDCGGDLKQHGADVVVRRLDELETRPG